MKILVTGGAGYIGSHVVKQLGESGHDITVYDNLSTGFKDNILYGTLVEADLADTAQLNATLEQGFDAVMHFAASIVVPESVAEPAQYYANNTVNTLNLIDACTRYGVKHFIFSSTAAVYGMPDVLPVAEDAPLEPINPYGSSKLMSEQMLKDIAAAKGLNYICLRYFNVAGADAQTRIGQATPKATHLIKVACETALGKRPQIQIYGTDYPTADGTCVRDYIHVDDLARAHLDALAYLEQGGESMALNCGYGHGFSVQEVLAAVEKVHGQKLNIVKSPRRAGDPPELIANAEKIQQVLGWQPQHNDLEFIIQTALAWEQKLLA